MRDLLTSTPLLQLGWFVALAVLIPLGVGVLLDRRFETAPLFILVGALVGIILSTLGAVRIASRAIGATSRRPHDPDEPISGKED